MAGTLKKFRQDLKEGVVRLCARRASRLRRWSGNARDLPGHAGELGGQGPSAPVAVPERLNWCSMDRRKRKITQNTSLSYAHQHQELL